MIKNFTGSDKKIFDILSRFRRSFKMELNALFAFKCLDPCVGDFSLVFHVLFVSHEHDNDRWLALGHDLVVPGGQVLESI